jgi:hypothetical protein
MSFGNEEADAPGAEQAAARVPAAGVARGAHVTDGLGVSMP